jgi:peptidoglycan hydrolase CwlO-like protein
MIPIQLVLRRAVVVAAVVLSLAVGVLAVRAAAIWTASAAPLTAAPVSAKTLAVQLADEQARSAALEENLSALSSQTNELAAALQAAQDQIVNDAKTARQLEAKLAAAKKKLMALNRSIQLAADRSTTTATSSGGSTSAPAAPKATEGAGDD